MKKYVVVLFSMLFVLTVVSAQQQAEPKKGNMPTIENRVEKMATDLGLNATEKASLKVLFEKQEADMKKFRDETNRDSPDFKDKMKEIRKKQTAELKALLGDEKFAKLEAQREEQRKKQPQQ